jgi:Sulfotransferase domain
MRIVISSPPKMGNKWIKCLLSRVYDLQWVIGEDSPDTNIERFELFVSEGRFPDNTIFHQHCKYKPKICDVIDEIPAHLVTIVRDPYDAFVSMYHWIQTRTDYDRERGRVRKKERPRDAMVGKPIDDPLILEYLADGYGQQIQRAHEWVHSGRAIVVRYEDLHRDPVAALTRVTNQIEPVDTARIEKAVEACSVDNMRKMSKRMSQHVRAAKVGDSRDTLGEPHLKIFREKYSDLLTSLGYEVR